MEQKHTKGPWSFEGDDRYGSIFATDAKGRDWNICDLGPPIDLICNAADDVSEGIRAEVVANARLIAAAPELLAALVEAEQRLRYSGDRFHDAGADLRAQADWAAADKAAAAILKATRGSL